MNKILKTISFLLLSVCFMLNATVVYAGCPRTSKNKVYEQIEGDCEWDYYNHETIKSWLDRDNDKKKIWMAVGSLGGAAIGAFIAGAPGAGVGQKVVGAIVAPTLGLIATTVNGNAADWVRISEDNDFCGVKLKYCKNASGEYAYKECQPQ